LPHPVNPMPVPLHPVRGLFRHHRRWPRPIHY
jgi:hypothetical protein